MLSKTFFESPRFQRRFTNLDKSNMASETERKADSTSTSTVTTLLSSDSSALTDIESSYNLRKKFAIEDEIVDAGIPGAYR